MRQQARFLKALRPFSELPTFEAMLQGVLSAQKASHLIRPSLYKRLLRVLAELDYSNLSDINWDIVQEKMHTCVPTSLLKV